MKAEDVAGSECQDGRWWPSTGATCRHFGVALQPWKARSNDTKLSAQLTNPNTGFISHRRPLTKSLLNT